MPRSTVLRAQGKSCTVDDLGVAGSAEALLLPRAALIAVAPRREVCAKQEAVAITTRQISHPAIRPEEHDTAPNRIRIRPHERDTSRDGHLDPGLCVTGRDELSGYEPALQLVAWPVPGSDTVAEAGAMSFD